MNNYKDLILYLKGLIILLESLDGKEEETLKTGVVRDVYNKVGNLADNLEKITTLSNN